MQKTEDTVNKPMEYIEELVRGTGPENFIVENDAEVDKVEKGDIISRSKFNIGY